jgi:hypothetical protein
MENEYYKTKDLAEAGALIINKHQLVQVERKNNICWFLFKDKNKCMKLANKFYFGEMVANIRDYHEILNRLKNRIFSK